MARRAPGGQGDRGAATRAGVENDARAGAPGGRSHAGSRTAATGRRVAWQGRDGPLGERRPPRADAGPGPARAPVQGYSRPLHGEQPPYLYEPYRSTLKRAPRRPPIPLPHTVSEVTGPGFSKGWAGP